MSIRDALKEIQISSNRAGEVAHPQVTVSGASYQKIASDLHRLLLDRVDLEVMSKLPQDRLQEEMRNLIEALIAEQGLALNAAERKQVVTDVQNEVMGLGPLEPLLADPTISDILVNSYKTVYVERFGKLERTNVVFSSDEHLFKIIDT